MSRVLWADWRVCGGCVSKWLRDIPLMWTLRGANPVIHTVRHENTHPACRANGADGCLDSVYRRRGRHHAPGRVGKDPARVIGGKSPRLRFPAVGDRQVLVRVRVVGLNRGELSRLEPDPERDRTGFVPGTDAAGDVVADRQARQGRSPGRAGHQYVLQELDRRPVSPRARRPCAGLDGRWGVWRTTSCWMTRMWFRFQTG